LQSHYQNISNYDTQIVQQTKARDIALGIVEAANPIINDVNNLNSETDALRKRITTLLPSLEDLKVRLNNIHFQVDEIVEAFSTIMESKHFDMSTDRYVQILVGLATATVKIDACCLNPAE
jgi:archaellum component FlaC